MDETALIDKLRRIEAQHAAALPGGATLDPAARMRARLRDLRAREPDVEFSFSVGANYAQRLLVALCRRYEIQPFRRPRQRPSTVTVKAPRSFLVQMFWPLFEALAHELERELIEATDRVVREAIGVDPTSLDEPGRVEVEDETDGS